MKMKFYLYLIFSIIIMGCSSINKQATIQSVDLEKLTHELFNDYPYKYDTNREKKYTNLIVVTIPKDHFNSNDYEKIKNKLIRNKWVNIDNFDNYYSFCNSEKYFIGILNPINKAHYARDGSQITFDNSNVWYFAFYYNNFGVNDCEEYLN